MQRAWLPLSTDSTDNQTPVLVVNLSQAAQEKGGPILNAMDRQVPPVTNIVSPLPAVWVISMLLCLQDYFGVCSEPVIKDNVVVVYEVLEEMLDNGFPLATESNILKELIKPPTILRTVVNTITGVTRGVGVGLREPRLPPLASLGSWESRLIFHVLGT